MKNSNTNKQYTISEKIDYYNRRIEHALKRLEELKTEQTLQWQSLLKDKEKRPARGLQLLFF